MSLFALKSELKALAPACAPLFSVMQIRVQESGGIRYKDQAYSLYRHVSYRPACANAARRCLFAQEPSLLAYRPVHTQHKPARQTCLRRSCVQGGDVLFMQASMR